jgi:hypothetical protein
MFTARMIHAMYKLSVVLQRCFPVTVQPVPEGESP